MRRTCLRTCWSPIIEPVTGEAVRMSEQQKHFPEFYVTAPQPCPYLAGRLERKLFTHLTHDKPPALVDNLLKLSLIHI